MPIPFSASAANRVAICAASASLPSVRSTESSEPARRGTALHAYLAAVPKVGRDEALTTIEDDEIRAACEAIDLSTLPVCGESYAAEVSFAYSPWRDAARELGRDLGRKYPPVADDEIIGTADVIGLTEDGTGVYVADYKSGWKHVPHPAENWQLALLALAATRAYGRMRAHVAIIDIREGERPRHRWHWWEPDDLEELSARAREIAGNVLALAAAADIYEADVVEGPHCEFCPAFTRCPAKTSLISLLASDPNVPAREVGDVRELTPERARSAYLAIQRVEMALAQAKEQIKAFAATSPFEVGDGVWYGPTIAERDSLNGAVARRVLVEKFGAEFADRASKWTVTKAGIKDAARARAAKTKEKITAIERDALEAIGAAGGITVSTSAPVKEHRR